MKCYKCKKEINLPEGKIKFRSYCEYCLSDLHVCLNCKYYSLGKPNDCEILTAEPVRDKEKYNFCEDFVYDDKKIEKKSKKKEISKKLFGDEDIKDVNFEDLFKK